MSPPPDQHYLEILAAGTEDNTVHLNELTLSRQNDINKCLSLKQLIKNCDQSAVVVVPPQAELLHPAHYLLSQPKQTLC